MANEIDREARVTQLLRLVRAKHSELAKELEETINEGKDVEETKRVKDERTNKGREHRYRKTVRLTDDEALERAIVFLESWLVELPLVINSAYSEFTQCWPEPQKVSNRDEYLHGHAVEIAVELGGAGDIVREDGQALQTLISVPLDQIESAREQLTRLRNILEVRVGK